MWFKLFNEWTTPMVALAALGIIVYFVHFKGQKTWEVGGKAVSIVKTVLMFIGVFYLMQVICGLVFGANLQSLYEGVGARTPLGPFMSPEYLGPLAVKQVACLLLSGIIAWEFAKSEKHVWHKRVAWICFLVLTCQSWWGFQARSDTDVARQKTQIQLASEALHRGAEAWLASGRSWLEHKADQRYLTGDRPQLVKIGKAGIAAAIVSGIHEVKGAYRTGTVDKRKELPVGSEWLVYSSDVLEGLDQTGMSYARMVGRESDEVVWIRQESFEELLASQPQPQPTFSAPATSVTLPASANTGNGMAKPVLAYQPNPEAAPVQVQGSWKRSTVQSDVITANTKDWTPCEVVPYPTERIEFGTADEDGKFVAFHDAAEVERIWVRVGRLEPIRLKPVERWDGYIGQVDIPSNSGPNRANTPERIKLASGKELTVAIQKAPVQ